MNDWQQELWDKSIELQTIQLNPNAALQVAIAADGFVPVESEFRYLVDSVEYAVQAAEHLNSGERRVYYAIVPVWSDVRWFGPDDVQFQIVNVIDQMPVHPTDRYETRPLSNITDLVIHHTVSSGDLDTTVIAEFHVSSRDWPGIGYHYVIDNAGRIEQVNHLETVSYHASEANSYSVGIALKGDFTNTPPPRQQLDATDWLVNHLRGDLAIKHTIGHRESPAAGTECPGNTWPQWKDDVT
jgi:hypothetical protein